MWSLLGRIFGGKKASEALVDSGLSIIDKAFYTKEERAEDHLKARIQAAEAVTAWLQVSGGPNLARRFIAMGIFLMWFLLWGISVVIDIATIFVADVIIRETMDQVVGRTRAYANDINAEMLLVLGYYFAAPQIDKFAAPLAQKVAQKVKAGKVES